MTSLFDRACAEHLFKKLSEHWRAESDYTGIYRPGYSRQESAAIAMVIEEATRIGMDCYADLAGNVYMIMRGANPQLKALVTGSHLDAVPQGGQYDGPAGVVGPLAMCSALMNAGRRPAQDVCVMIIRAEESPWFAQSSIGSRLALGTFPAEKMTQLVHREDGQTLAYHMEQCGVSAYKLQKPKPLFPSEQAAAFIELHIEQGPQLYHAGKPVAVVTSNRGSVRIPKILVQGEGGHTGAVPMALRRDAVRAAARFITLFEDSCQELVRLGHDIVFTIPVIAMGKGASPTTIPKECSFYLEARSASGEMLEHILEKLEDISAAVQQQYGVAIHMDAPLINKPALMDNALQDALSRAADKRNIAHTSMPSGGSHDAAVFANARITSGMLFIRHEGHSHRPDENMDMDDLAAACEVLAQCCLDGFNTDQVTTVSFVDALIAHEAEPIMMQDYAPAATHR